MSRGETVTTPSTPGAGRRMSYSWPACGRTSVSAISANGGDVTGRPNGISLASYYLNTTTGAPPAPVGMQIYKRRVAWAMTSSTGTGFQAVPNFGGVNRPLVMPFQNIRGAYSPLGIDDFACWSIAAILAFEPIPGVVTGDLGIAIGSGTRFNVRLPANQFAGMEFGPTNTGVIGVFARQADLGAPTFNQATPFQPDIREWHKYEIRFIGPSINAEAQAKFLIDGRVQFALPWGAGTVLPAQAEPAPTNVGFTPGIGNREAVPGSTTTMYMAAINGFVVSSGPTEAALL
jgi:hypothetical protein